MTLPIKVILKADSLNPCGVTTWNSLQTKMCDTCSCLGILFCAIKHSPKLSWDREGFILFYMFQSDIKERKPWQKLKAKTWKQ